MYDYREILAAIYEKAPRQRKKIEKDFSGREAEFLNELNVFLTDYLGFLKAQHIDVSYAVDAYVNLCNEMTFYQLKFLKTGQYPVKTLEESSNEVYTNPEKMNAYMVGLALSQFMWKTHYEIYKFYQKLIADAKDSVRSYLEVGPGHGLFLKQAITGLSNAETFTVVDISPQSIEITKSLIEYFFKECEKVTYHNCDIMDFPDITTYELITMGEVLEHVANPDALLRKLRSLLASNGKMFVSTCVNCPASDHIYHYRGVEEIRQMFYVNGLSIIEEMVLPVEDIPMDEIIKRKITVNYCAVLRKGDGRIIIRPYFDEAIECGLV
ncbi:class I SAM-dependent methyltransferase [Candidatus Magnetomonas plexicatena]|uniref:class I SAM-dependent methyltransferase n=1 Tax=Candidatus Magnetomonas plexicatena TaxID=2552947 RepID=UPI001C765330|nr:class I SAM-dependent methyltransferase [Nitrospirales bacterium LBB_01]